MLYLDASAITKLVVEEQETRSLQELVRGRPIASSRVAVVEVGKAVARANPAADAGAVIALFTFVELDAELASLAAVTGGTQLRALDAIHVASALRLGRAVEAFVTYDVRQATTARGNGLSVESPGTVLDAALGPGREALTSAGGFESADLIRNERESHDANDQRR